jgi:GTP-binding protein
MTSGTGIMHRVFSHYGSVSSQEFFGRGKGALVSMANGKSSSFALNNLQARGRLLISSNEEIYEGMIVGLHSRENDLPVNPMKAKQLTNVRAAGTDENISLSEPIRLTVESALEFIEDDELVEVTPNHLRLRKKMLTENERKRALRAST